MAESITLTNLANLQNETTAVTAINNNNSAITTAFTDVLSRSGTQPNQMGAPIDMNNWPIMNLPAPGSANSPARLVDVTSTNPISISLSLQGDVTAPASSGVLTTTVGKVNGVTYPSAPTTSTVPVVTSANTITYEQIPTAAIATGAVTATQIANNTITATQIAANGVTNAAIRQSAGLSVIGTTGSVTANVADITGTTRQVLAVNTAGTGLTFAQPQGDQLKGTVTNDAASAGNVGEVVTSTVTSGSGIALTATVPANITSISLTAGDWDVSGAVYINPAATTTVTGIIGSAGSTTATVNGTPGFFFQHVCGSFAPNSTMGYAIPTCRFSLSATTTIFLVAQVTFGTSTCTGFGEIIARRAR